MGSILPRDELIRLALIDEEFREQLREQILTPYMLDECVRASKGLLDGSMIISSTQAAEEFNKIQAVVDQIARLPREAAVSKEDYYDKIRDLLINPHRSSYTPPTPAIIPLLVFVTAGREIVEKDYKHCVRID